MKKLALIVGVAALAACNQAEAPAEEAAETEEAVEESVEVAQLAPDGGPVAGTYNVTRGDENWSVAIAEDMSYVQTMADGTEITGTMRMQDDMTPCFDPEGDEEGETCFNSAIGEDGTWTSTDPDGEVATVVRAES